MIINISNTSNTSYEQNKTHIINKNNNNIISNNPDVKQVDNNAELNSEKYDLIYSDFFSQGNNVLKKTPVLSTRAKESTGNSTIQNNTNFVHTKITTQDSLPLSKREIQVHSKSITKQQTKPKINEYINKKPTTINTSNDMNDNHNNNNSGLNNHKIDFSVGNRLYNRGFYIKNKQEEIRQKVHNENLSKMKPHINQTNKFSYINKKPLYYNPSNYNDNSLSPIFTHKPSINALSAKIASNLEPASTRLLRKKKKPKQLNNSITISSKSKILINNYYEHVNMHYTKSKPCIKMNNSTNNSKDYNDNSNDYNQIIPKRVNDLYVNGLLQKKKREEIYQQHIKDKNSSYKSFSYKPEQSKMSQMINEYLDYTSSNNNKSSNDFYQKQMKWKLNIEKRTDKKKQELLKEDCDECTFKPMINNNNLNVELGENNLDEKYCNLYSGAGLDYIVKRRKNIQDKNKPVKNKEKKVNLSMKQLTRCYTKTNKERANNKVKYIEEMRDKFNTKEFFCINDHHNLSNNNSNIQRCNNFGNNDNDNKEIIFQNMVCQKQTYSLMKEYTIEKNYL